MILLHQLFPSYTRYSAYLTLLAAVANNFGTFVGTLVVQQKVTSFWGAFFNAIGLLISAVATLAFQLRVSRENILYSMMLNKCF
jgi:phosphate/sulfate permease